MTYFVVPVLAALVIVALNTSVLVRRDRRTMACRRRSPRKREPDRDAADEAKPAFYRPARPSPVGCIVLVRPAVFRPNTGDSRAADVGSATGAGYACAGLGGGIRDGRPRQ
jgi:hypothetical protein